MISAVICMLLRRVWHLCNFPCVSELFRLIYIAKYVFRSPSICFWGTKYDVYCENVVYLHSILWRRVRLWLELFASADHGYHICLRRSFTSRKLYACLERFLCFLQLYDRTHVSGALCIGLLTVLITYLLSAFVWMKVDFISGLVIVERAFYPRNDFILFQSFN